MFWASLNHLIKSLGFAKNKKGLGLFSLLIEWSLFDAFRAFTFYAFFIFEMGVFICTSYMLNSFMNCL